FTRGPPEFRGRPQALITTIVVAVLAGADSLRVLEQDVRILLRPEPGLARRFQVARRELCIEGLIHARGDGGHRRQVGRGTGAFVRRLPRPNHFTRKMVVFGHYEGGKMFAGLLVPYAAIVIMNVE